MQCPNCGSVATSQVCLGCGVNMKESYERRIRLGAALFGKCTCVDKAGDCDYCGVYYADERDLDELEANMREIKKEWSQR